jgi:hypothetical protein
MLKVDEDRYKCSSCRQWVNLTLVTLVLAALILEPIKIFYAVDSASSANLSFLVIISWSIFWLFCVMSLVSAIVSLASLFEVIPAWRRLGKFKKYIQDKVEESSQWQALDQRDQKLLKDSIYEDFWYEYRNRYEDLFSEVAKTSR